jgi:alkylhydroperoxidase family enzyme
VGNSAAARQAGITDEEIDALLGDVDDMPLPDAEKAVVRLADQMTLLNPDGFLTEELYRDLREHWSDAEVFELGMTMAVLCGMAKFLFVFDMVSREASCPIHKPA